MDQDISPLLSGWEYKPGVVQARLVQADDGRQVIQLRIDLGLLQLEETGRPDGSRPHGFASYFAYLEEQARLAARAGERFALNDDQCQEADREFVQFYHRRLCWLALRRYSQAVADADHTLAFMKLVKKHSPSEEFTRSHEQHRAFVIFQRTQAAAALALEIENPEQAVDAVRSGVADIAQFFVSHGLEDHAEDNPLVEQLRKMETSLRKTHGIKETLQEQLQQAVANEQYEIAAQIRDAMKRGARVEGRGTRDEEQE